MGLNPQQREAVEHEGGPLLVLAGAGSGKTRVITARIARLLESGVKPPAILAVTFTNKAAAEMRERIAAIVGKRVAEALWLSTFHSFGVRFVREESTALGLGARFTVFDQGDCLGLVRELLRTEATVERQLDAQAVLSRISLWKNAMLEPARVRARGDEYDQAAVSIYAAYEDRLADMHALDFDDLVTKPVRLLKSNPGVRQRWRSKFAQVLVDEFQDTNEAQLELVRLLTNAEGNIVVVGDDDQAIYGWRGACVQNILQFERHFPGASVTKLEQNYRSREPILNVANAAIARAHKGRYAKVLRPVRDGGEPVRVCAFPGPQEEAKFVAAEIRTLAKDGLSLRDIAVLYRSNNQAKRIEEEFRVAGIDYRLFGGTKFFDRKEIKDAIAYLRVALNPRDELSLRRIVNTPARGLGTQSFQQIVEHGERHRIGVLKALGLADRIDGLPSRAQRSALTLAAALERSARGFHSGSSAEVAAALLSDVGMLDEAASDDKAKKRNANMRFLLQSIRRVEERSGADRAALQQLLHHMTLDKGEDGAEDAGAAVTLSSLHSAKGLEFPVVFLIGCVEGVLPHARTTDPKVTDAVVTDIEEERRLFYVGVTRARDLLYVSRYGARVQRGRIIKITPSRFLEGLPEADTEEYQSRGSVEMERDEVAAMAKALLDRLGGGEAPGN